MADDVGDDQDGEGGVGRGGARDVGFRCGERVSLAGVEMVTCELAKGGRTSDQRLEKDRSGRSTRSLCNGEKLLEQMEES